jgi:hypothetical protein
MSKRRRRTVDLCSILRASDAAREYVRWTREVCFNLTTDPKKAERLEKSQCVVCFYARGRMGAAVVTTAQCGVCDRTIHSGNSCVGVVCVECGKAHEFCTYCGGDIRMRTRRKFDRTVVTPTLDEDLD